MFLATITTFAQQGINYKAIVKDNMGNVVANQSVTVQFDINLGLNPVYQEEHTVNTDANGLVILNIGTGNILSGNFSTIDWNLTGAYYLKVQMDTGSGLVNLGATQFRAVPFALYAEKSGNIEPTGLEAIDEGNGFGWSLIGRNPDYYGNIGENAVDFSSYYLAGTSSTRGATGLRSTAMGVNTTASGNNSTALGINTEASGNSSTAIGNYTRATGQNTTSMGYDTIASGSTSSAMGYETTASGDNSTAIGFRTIANDVYSTVVGKYNDEATSTTTLFQVGNGIYNNRSNAFTILQNGFTAVGTHNNEPTTDFQVNHGVAGTINGFKLQNSGSNENWWRFYTVNSNGSLYLYSKTGGNSNAVGSFNNVSGAYTALSDRRVKDNFKELYFNWKDFMQLKPLTYNYKTDKNKQLNIGFVAQDVVPIYPELVNYNQEDDLYQLNYSGFGVVAIKAIQEQQIIIEDQQKQIDELKKLVQSLLENEE
jgi:hypothetical protein